MDISIVPFNLDQECILAFKQLNKSLIATPVTKSPKWDQPFEIICETNNNVESVVLVRYKADQFRASLVATMGST